MTLMLVFDTQADADAGEHLISQLAAAVAEQPPHNRTVERDPSTGLALRIVSRNRASGQDDPSSAGTLRFSMPRQRQTDGKWFIHSPSGPPLHPYASTEWKDRYGEGIPALGIPPGPAFTEEDYDPAWDGAA